jgi:pimeloyl-ACP methyl ester carboxylesterase
VIRTQYLELDGTPTRYLEAGSGWPVLLLHAFPLNADMWRPQLDRVPNGWRFIAPDLRGFGPAPQDERIKELDTSYMPSMDDYARDLGELLDALRIDDLIIGGLSMGGYVTFALLRQAPERFTGMLLADTKTQADTANGRAARAKMRDLLAERGPSGVADQMIPRLLSGESREKRPALVEETRRMIESNAPAALDGALAAMMERPDSTGDLAHVSCPALVLVGDRDEVTPMSDAERMHEVMSRSRLTVIHGAGHLSSLERPDEFSRALHDFLVAHM